MGDETWANIQLVKSKRESFREKMKQRKAERETILSSAIGTVNVNPIKSFISSIPTSTSSVTPVLPSVEDDGHLERSLLEALTVSLTPLQSARLTQKLSINIGKSILSTTVNSLLQKFAIKGLLCVTPLREGLGGLTIVSIDNAKVMAALETDHRDNKHDTKIDFSILKEGKRESSNEWSENICQEPPSKLTRREEESVEIERDKKDNDVMSLLSAQSIRERETKKVGEEIMELLSKPTAKEQSLAERFRSQGGAKVKEFCPHGTIEECDRANKKRKHKCGRLHFHKIIQKHTDESLGDCSFLNTCFHMDTCRYVHYEVDYSGVLELHEKQQSLLLALERPRQDERTILFPPQWIQCDLRFLDMSILGKFAVIMADPPWDIHMELPYGTMSDDEMRQLQIPTMQDEGLIFLWVTGRAMELGRECLKLWGYDRVDEIIWVKTNQLQRIIRTGRTGHWLNHGKEHCLVGMKGNPKINKGLDSDVIVAEVRATSHKPDEIYGIIERLSPGTRKLELFGRPHNVQPNWVTLGNQLEGVNLLEEDLVKSFNERYPDGICRKQTPQ